MHHIFMGFRCRTGVGLGLWRWQAARGTRIKTVASPHLIPCINPSPCSKDKPDVAHQESASAAAQSHNSIGNYIKVISCGGRHSAVITGEPWEIVVWYYCFFAILAHYFCKVFLFVLSDAGVLITFGWSLYGQVTSLLNCISYHQHNCLRI